MVNTQQATQTNDNPLPRTPTENTPPPLALRLASAIHQVPPVDVLVIGGGVNGSGIARDAAGRGLSVLLCDMRDLGSATSSSSTKLIHGGLRYLEHYAFRLVRESLNERMILLKALPHLSWPMRFILPHVSGGRPAWMVRLGLLFYDHLGGNTAHDSSILPPTRWVNLRTDPVGQALQPQFTLGFEYSDCWVDDARLVTLNARDAARRGARILTWTRFISAQREATSWNVRLRQADHSELTVSAKIVINASGPWVEQVINQMPEPQVSRQHDQVRLVRGSHVVVPRLFDHDRAYLIQNHDRRVVFAIPYETHYTLLGTTEVDHDDPDQPPVCSLEEAGYLCAAASAFFRTPVRPQDVIWTYSGTRPLYNNHATSASATSRDYVLDLSAPPGLAPLLNIFGGKLTTYRRLSETAVNKIAPLFPQSGPAWTAHVPLPGGDFSVKEGIMPLVRDVMECYPFVNEPWATRLVRAYGKEVPALYGDSRRLEDLGTNFGATLYAREIAWLMTHEYARCALDVVWRRSKLGLQLTADHIQAIDRWMTEQPLPHDANNPPAPQNPASNDLREDHQS